MVYRPRWPLTSLTIWSWIDFSLQNIYKTLKKINQITKFNNIKETLLEFCQIMSLRDYRIYKNLAARVVIKRVPAPPDSWAKQINK